MIWKYKINAFINFLCKEKDLKLVQKDYNIIEKKKINSCNFFKTIEEKLHNYEMAGRSVIRLIEFIKEFSKRKLKSFLLYKSLKKVLIRYILKVRVVRLNL